MRSIGHRPRDKGGQTAGYVLAGSNGAMDAIAICVTVPIQGGGESPGYRPGPPIGVVAYDATVGAWMPDRDAVAVLPGIAHRAWPSRAAAIDGLRRVLLAPGVRGLLGIRVLSAVDGGGAQPGFVRARLGRVARAARRRPAGVTA